MLFKVIVWLLPALAQQPAYGRLIERNARVHRLDPLLIVAVIKVESNGYVRATSPTNDYGLMQLHVSHTTHKRFLGREHLLFEPARNIRLGARMLRFWRRHHRKHCKGSRHHWWAHYNWGYRVRSREYGKKVHKVYRQARRRAGHPEVS